MQNPKFDIKKLSLKNEIYKLYKEMYINNCISALNKNDPVQLEENLAQLVSLLNKSKP